MLQLQIRTRFRSEVRALQRAQKREELSTLGGRQFQTELVALDGTGFRRRRTPATRDVSVLEAIGVEHFFEGRGRSIVQKMAAIPHAFE